MEQKIKEEIKEVLKQNIRKFFKSKDKTPHHVLNHIFPVERRIRSLIGGLETNLGTQFWEPIAKKLAELNGFRIITEKVLIPVPFPEELRKELDQLIYEREHTKISSIESIERLRNSALKANSNNIKYNKPPSGTGIDIHFIKNNIEYVFDTKTTQPNQGHFKSFNKQLLEWYAYRFSKAPQTQIKARIIIPFNPYTKDWYEEKKSMLSSSPLDVTNDIWVGNEFWDFCSGLTNTLEHLESLFIELGKEDFTKEFDDIFYRKIEQMNKKNNII